MTSDREGKEKKISSNMVMVGGLETTIERNPQHILKLLVMRHSAMLTCSPPTLTGAGYKWQKVHLIPKPTMVASISSHCLNQL